MSQASVGCKKRNSLLSPQIGRGGSRRKEM
nr:MAG TPA: hypothetical protein [Caudoviricetes sp.]